MRQQLTNNSRNPTFGQDFVLCLPRSSGSVLFVDFVPTNIAWTLHFAGGFRNSIFFHFLERRPRTISSIDPHDMKEHKNIQEKLLTI